MSLSRFLADVGGYPVQYLVSNVIALLLLAAAFRWPRQVRWAFVAIFVWASATNASVAVRAPTRYLDYAALTWSGSYRAFIEGAFSRHIVAIVLAIAAGQLATGLLIARRRTLGYGVMGAAVFLVAIVPLGVGSGFPCSLLLAAALIVARRRLDRQPAPSRSEVLPYPAVAAGPASPRGPRVLVAYATRYGQTAKIATRIAGGLKGAGCVVTLAEIGDLGAWTSLGGFSGVIVGASVIGGRHQRSSRRFVVRHRDALNELPSAFFSVSGSAGSVEPGERDAARTLMERFLADARWHPWAAATFGGAIAYTRYSPILRLVIRRMSAKKGGPTDTTRDHETTDWEAVERFARAFAASVVRAGAAHVPEPVAPLRRPELTAVT